MDAYWARNCFLHALFSSLDHSFRMAEIYNYLKTQCVHGSRRLSDKGFIDLYHQLKKERLIRLKDGLVELTWEGYVQCSSIKNIF